MPGGGPGPPKILPPPPSFQPYLPATAAPAPLSSVPQWTGSTVASESTGLNGSTDAYGAAWSNDGSQQSFGKAGQEWKNKSKRQFQPSGLGPKGRDSPQVKKQGRGGFSGRKG